MMSNSALSDIAEVTEEFTEDGTCVSKKKKDAATLKAIDRSFHKRSCHISVEEEECAPEWSKTTSCTKESVASKTSKNYMISVDQDTFERLSNLDGDSDDGSDVRKAKLCCFVCCDLVRACIISNIVYIILLVILLSISIYDIQVFAFLGLNQNDMDDDDVGYYLADDYFINHTEEKVVNIKYILSLVRTGCAIFFAAVGVLGAFNFHQTMVLCTATWYCIYIVWCFVDMRLSGAIIAIFFAYPNWHLFWELRKGSIRRGNYEVEKYCCCQFCYNPPEYI